MIKKFRKYIKEGYGVSDVVKKYVTSIMKHIKNNNELYITDEIITLKDSELKLKNFLIDISIGDKNRGVNDTTYSYVKNDTLYNMVISIECKKMDYNLIEELLYHELTHVLEFYKINLKNNIFKANFSEGKLKMIYPNWININSIRNRASISENIEPFKKFLYLIYLSLDCEMNARISQLYPYLLNNNIFSEENGLDIVKKHNTWSYVETLRSFNPDIFLETCKDYSDITEICDFFNNINYEFKKLNIGIFKKLKEEIKNEKDILYFLHIFKKIFQKKCEKHEIKIVKLIKNVVKINNNIDETKKNYNIMWKINDNFDYDSDVKIFIYKFKKVFKNIVKNYSIKFNKDSQGLNNGLCEEISYDVVEECGGENEYFFIMDDGFFWNTDKVSPFKTKDNEYWNIDNFKIYGEPPLPYNMLNKYTMVGHSWVFCYGKHYDSECLDGVENFWDLPIFKRMIGVE
jgi:hypothetical protein